MRTIAIDFETFYDTKAGHGIREQGMFTYTRDPRFDAYMVSVSDGSDHWAGHPNDFNWSALEGAVLLSHNAAFDSNVYTTLVERGRAPKIQFADWICTANMTSYLCSRRDLARACEFLLGVEVDKTERGKADGRRWEDFPEADRGAMLEYARKDAKLCHELFARYGHLWPERERKLSSLTIRQGQRGAQIDLPKLMRFLSTAEKMRVLAEAALPWIREGRKPTSPKAIAEECRREGIPCPPVKSRDGDEAYDAWAAEYAPRFKWVKAFTDYRVIEKFIGSLETVKARLMPDAAFPFDLLYFGAHTGRWTGSGGFNMQNLRKEPLFCDQDGTLVTDGDKLSEISEAKRKKKPLPSFVQEVLDIRALFIPRPGKRMIVSDLSQIEPRVLAWVAGDQSMLSLLATGQSPYEAHARATMGWKGGKMKDEDLDGYSLAKARVLGLGYGCGWEKFITVAYTMAGLDITKDDPESIPALAPDGSPCIDGDGNPVMISGYGMTSKKIVEDYRASNPLITALWRRLDDDFKASVGGDFSIELPSGRTLRYPDVKQEWKSTRDPKNPMKFRKKLVTTALAYNNRLNAVVREAFYGGLLTENLVQATARDVFGEHCIGLDETSGVEVLWTIHDEAVTEVDEGITAKDIEHAMSWAPDWIEGLPVAAEAKEVPHYCK